MSCQWDKLESINMAESVNFLNNADLFRKSLYVICKMIYTFNYYYCHSPFAFGANRKEDT